MCYSVVYLTAGMCYSVVYLTACMCYCVVYLTAGMCYLSNLPDFRHVDPSSMCL